MRMRAAPRTIVAPHLQPQKTIFSTPLSLATCGTCRQSQLASFSQLEAALESAAGEDTGGGCAMCACMYIYACAHNYGYATWSATVLVVCSLVWRSLIPP